MSLLQEFQLEESLASAEALLEDMSWNAGKPLESQLDQAIARLDAAKRALSIANRLQDPASRKKHRSRVMGMLNSLRASLWRLQDAIQGEIEAAQQ